MKKVIIPLMLAFGLIIGSCNTDRTTRQHKERNTDDRTEVRDRYESDSVVMEREKTIQYDDEGNIERKKVETETREKD